jgi:hypothetical protein
VEGFYDKPRKRKLRVLTPAVLSQAQQLLNAGRPRAAVAQALGLKLNTLSKSIFAGRLVVAGQGCASGVSKSERSVADSQAGMGMGCTREVEQVAAVVGQLAQAPSRFEALLDVPDGGVLWALPALLPNRIVTTHTDFLPDAQRLLQSISRNLYGGVEQSHSIAQESKRECKYVVSTFSFLLYQDFNQCPMTLRAP